MRNKHWFWFYVVPLVFCDLGLQIAVLILLTVEGGLRIKETKRNSGVSFNFQDKIRESLILGETNKISSQVKRLN